MEKSSFKSDLAEEQILGHYLDEVYHALIFDFDRISSMKLQMKGVDLILKHKGKSYHIDEKSQLHYLNKDLPTFTFELSYLKNGQLRMGWLFDRNKTTDYYFLITGIYLNEGGSTLQDHLEISRIKITSVNRKKLLSLLTKRGLSEDSLNQFDQHIRETEHYGQNEIDRLNSKTEGLIYFTEHLEEKPMNLQLRLSFLIKTGVAKKIYPIALFGAQD